MIERNKDGRQIIFMILVSLISQITILARSSMVASIFGATYEMDAFNISNSIVSFVFGFITSGIMTIVMPEYVKKSKAKSINAFITFVYSIVIMIIIVIFLLRYQILALVTNRDEAFIFLASNVLSILLLSNSIASISSIAIAYSQAKGSFVIPKLISFLGQLLIFSCLLIMHDKLTIYSYTIIMASGLIVDSFLNIILSMRYGWRFYPTYTIRNKETKELIIRFLPLVFSAGIFQVSLFIDSIIAANLETGKITILSYSSQIVGMINSVIIANLTAYFYPRIIKQIANGDNQENFWKLTGILHLLTCMLICGFLTIGSEGIALIFQHGMFDKNTTEMVFVGASIYMVGQQVNIVRDLIYKYFYANGNTKTPVENSLIASILNITISIAAVKSIGYYGIAIGTVCSSALSLIVIMIRFRHFYSYKVSKIRILKMYTKNILATCLSVVAVFAIKQRVELNNLILSIIVFGCLAVLLFSLFSFLLSRNLLASYRSNHFSY